MLFFRPAALLSYAPYVGSLFVVQLVFTANRMIFSCNIKNRDLEKSGLQIIPKNGIMLSIRTPLCGGLNLEKGMLMFMNFPKTYISCALLLAAVMFLATACSGSPKKDSQTFAQAHDSFQTKLIREDSDSDPVPPPPAGVFDQVTYPSKVGDLAAYVSSDPGDGQKHPMIIWVVGGWGNGIDEFPWTYPTWDNDQTGSAFWRAGVLTMYPSFRGGNGNPGYYEALFGEVDDIISAYEYAASLPYVDPQRIYLGGHSTGGTRALLAAEYSDKFRAVFCFGAVDEVKYHNNSQFTFDTSNEMEYTMRSPIHWLDDVYSPTFLIEGSEGNADNLRNIESTSKNNQINCYIIEGADHFAALAPVTQLLAEKILADTGPQCAITLTMEELEQAMAQDPPSPIPIMTEYYLEEQGMHFSYPFIWDIENDSGEDGIQLSLYSKYDDENPWDMSAMYIYTYEAGSESSLSEMAEALQSAGYEMQAIDIHGRSAFEGYGLEELSDGNFFNNNFLIIQNETTLIEVDFYLHEDFGDAGDNLFHAIASSIVFD